MKSRLVLIVFICVLSGLLLAGCGAANITLTITADPSHFSETGEKITFNYVVSNSGDAPLDNISFARSSPPLNCQPHGQLTPSNPSFTCTAVYTVSADDVANGRFTYEDTAFGYGSSGNVCGGGCGGGCGGKSSLFSSTAKVVLLLGEQPSFSLSITSAPVSFQQAGQEIKYSYLVQNTGNVDITEKIVIQDDLVTATCPANTLPIGGTLTCTASYISTSEDVTERVIRNTAFAQAGLVQSESVIHEVPFDGQPALSLDISGSQKVYSYDWESIKFTYTLTNTGNVPLTGPCQIVSTTLSSFACPEITAFATGTSQTCTGIYDINGAFLGSNLTHSAIATCIYNGQTVESPPASFSISYVLPPTQETVDRCAKSSYPDHCIPGCLCQP